MNQTSLAAALTWMTSSNTSSRVITPLMMRSACSKALESNLSKGTTDVEPFRVSETATIMWMQELLKVLKHSPRGVLSRIYLRLLQQQGNSPRQEMAVGKKGCRMLVEIVGQTLVQRTGSP